MADETKPPAPSHKRPKKPTEKGPKGNVASQKIADAVGAAAKTISIHNVSKPTGGHEPRRESGEKGMSAHKENGSMFEGFAQQPVERRGREEVRRLVHRHQRESRQAGDRDAGLGHQVGQGNPARSDFRRADRVRQKVRRAIRQRRPLPLAPRIIHYRLPDLILSVRSPFPSRGKGLRVRFSGFGLSLTRQGEAAISAAVTVSVASAIALSR